jgi:hypothetical protein
MTKSWPHVLSFEEKKPPVSRDAAPTLGAPLTARPVSRALFVRVPDRPVPMPRRFASGTSSSYRYADGISRSHAPARLFPAHAH